MKNVESLDISPQFSGYSGVIIWTGEETREGKTVKTFVSSGDTTGRTLELTCPWATQATADNIKNAILGFQYQPMTASGAMLDPAAELGDGVTANGIYSGIYEQTETFTRRHLSDIAAPTEEEIDHEYPFESKADRQTERRYKQTRAQLEILTNEVNAKVSSVYDGSAFGWRLIANEFSVYSGNTSNKVLTVTRDGAKVKGRIEADTGYIGGSNGWTIKSGCIYTGNKSGFREQVSGVYAGTDGISLGTRFEVDSAGNLKASNADITGSIKATSGKIGGNTGWTINTGYICTQEKQYGVSGAGIYLGNAGIQLGNNFKVDSAGNLNATSGKFTGTVYAGRITGEDSTSGAGRMNGSHLQDGSVGGGGGNGKIANGTISKANCEQSVQNLFAQVATIASGTIAKLYVTALSCGSFKLDGTTGSWTQKLIDGQSIRYLGW